MQQSRNRSVHIQVDLAALKHNFSIARQLAAGQKLFAVVKADAYGHGALEVTNALSSQADGFAVVTLEEALQLRDGGYAGPLLVLQGPQQRGDIDSFREHHLWPVLHDHVQIRWFDDQSDRQPLDAWIKIDTGLGRLGFQPEELPSLFTASSAINWTGMLSHLACADEPGNAHTRTQLETFHSLPAPAGLQRSIANSAGLLGWPGSKADWARPGIMLYGSNPMPDSHAAGAGLVPVMTVTAPIVSRKTMKAGSTVGYAGSFVCPSTMDIGFVAIGYADGLPRVLDASATVFVAGEARRILGRVSMDSIAIDLTGNDARVGERVQLWGTEHPAERLATAAGTISYELFTGIRGHRHYGENKM